MTDTQEKSNLVSVQSGKQTKNNKLVTMDKKLLCIDFFLLPAIDTMEQILPLSEWQEIYKKLQGEG